jgi:outer membrane protein
MLMLPHSAFAWGFEGGVGYWFTTPSGNISYGPNGSSLDIGLDLQLNEKDTPYAWFKVETPHYWPNLYVMATPMRFDGTGQKNASFTFGDHTFQANIAVQSKIQMDHYDITFYYPISYLKRVTNDILNIDLGLDGRLMDFNSSLSQTVNGNYSSVSKSLLTVLPLGYMGIQIYPAKMVGFEGEFHGVFYGSNNYMDIIGRIRVRPYGPFFIDVGHRYEAYKFDWSGVKGNLTAQGPFIELGVKF